MKWPGKRSFRAVGVVVSTPPALWLGTLLLLPMGWARDRVIADLRASTRQEVRLERVRLRPWGGLELIGLTLASPATAADPWLKVAAVNVDAQIGDLIRGRIRPSACRASGVSLRVHRDASGRLECNELLRHDATGKARAPGQPGATPAADPELTVSLEDARVIVVDDATQTRLDLTDVHAHAKISKSSVNLTDLRGTLNGGTFSAAAEFSRETGHSLEVRLQIRDVNLGVGMTSLTYLVPILAPNGSTVHARGTIGIEADLVASGDSPDDLARSLTGRGHISLDNLTLDDSRILNEVQSLLPVPTRGKLGSLAGHFAIADRRVSTSDTILKVAEVPIDLAGWSDFDGRLDYLVKCEKLGKAVSKLAGKLPREARDLLADLSLDDLSGLADVRVFGTIEHPRAKSVGVTSASPKPVAANSKPGAKKPIPRASDKAKLKQAAHMLLERALR